MELERGVIGHEGIVGDLRDQQIGIDVHVGGRESRRHRRVEPAPNMDQVAGLHVLLRHRSARLAAPPARCRMQVHELVKSEDRMPHEELGRHHLLICAHIGMDFTCCGARAQALLAETRSCG